MAWVRIDDHFDEHPKLQQVGPLGWGVWMAGLAYCNRNLTDGFIPWTKARTLVSFDVAEENGVIWSLSRTSGMSGEDIDAHWVIDLLVAAGLWDVVQSAHGRIEGYRIHDYTDYQPSRAQIEEERAKTAKRQEAWRERHKQRSDAIMGPVSNGERNGVTHDSSNAVTNDPVTSAPNPNPNPSSSSLSDEEKTYVTAGSRSPKTPPPENGEAQQIVAAYCREAGLDAPANYGKAVGLAAKLVKAGITAEDVPALFAASNWGDGADLGKMLGMADRFRAAKHAPPQPRKYPDPLQKRIDLWTAERLAGGKPILPYPEQLQAALDDYAASQNGVRR